MCLLSIQGTRGKEGGVNGEKNRKREGVSETEERRKENHFAAKSAAMFSLFVAFVRA